jgi:signal transduction histidine kinase
MDLISVLVLVSLILNTLLGLVFYIRAPRKPAYFAFEFTIFGIVGWCLSMFFYRLAPDILSTLFWVKMLYLFPTFIPAGFILFGLLFPNYKLNKWIFGAICLFNLLMAVLSVWPRTVITGIEIPKIGEKIIYFGWAYYYLYLFYIPSLFTLSYIVLFRKYRHETPLVRQQILYVLLGLTGASIVGMSSNLILPTFNYFKLNWLGQVTLFFWVGCATYAIIRHRLVNIRLVVARTVSYSLLMFVLATFYISSLFSVGRLFYQEKISGMQILINVFLGLIVAFTFQPLRRFLEKITDKIFFKDHYDTENLLTELTKILSSTLILKKLLQASLERLLAVMKVETGIVVLWEGNKIKDIFSGNATNEDSLKNIDQGGMEHLLNSTDQPLIFDELPEGRRKEALRKINFYFAQKLQVKEKVIGLLLLGEKLSGDIYSGQDIELLTILSSQLAVAIENALAYQKIQKFSDTLKIEIDKATEALQTTNEKLRNVSALKDEFVSLTSHELRTPLTAIAGSLSTVLEGFAGKVGPKTREFLAGAYNENLRLIRLVNNLLNISRIESGRLKFLPSNFDLALIIKEVIENLKTEALEKKIELLANCEAKTMVYADQDKVREILINLVGNAIKFTDKGRVAVTAWIQDGLAVVQVEDSGRGILPENQQKLFKKFERVDNSEANRAKGGTGLGLYICKNLLKGMNGDIWLKSNYGTGTTFYFTLPSKQ